MWLAKLTFLTCTKTKSVAPIWLEIDSLQWFALSLDLPYNSNLTNGEKRFWPTIPLALTIPGRNKWLPCSRYLLALWMENFSNGTDFPAIRCLYSGSRLIQRKPTGVQSFSNHMWAARKRNVWWFRRGQKMDISSISHSNSTNLRF